MSDLLLRHRDDSKHDEALPHLSDSNGHNKPAIINLMRWKGPAWAADCIARRHRIRRRHAVLIVGMLGIAGERG